jgi:hypothetical protein
MCIKVCMYMYVCSYLCIQYIDYILIHHYLLIHFFFIWRMRSTSYYELEIKNKNKKEILSANDSKNKNCVNVFIEDFEGDDEGMYVCMHLHVYMRRYIYTFMYIRMKMYIKVCAYFFL